MPTNDGQGKNWAIACLVLGIVSIVFCVFGYGALLGIIAAIIGLVGSSKAKKVDIKVEYKQLDLYARLSV